MKMRGRVDQAVRVLLFVLLAGCAAKAPPPSVPRWVAKTNTPFGLTLLKEAWKQRQGPNVVVSPVSVGLALAMTVNGADGTTREAMQKAMNLQDIAVDTMNAGYLDAQRALDSPGRGVQLALANSLWLDDGFQLQNAFLATTQQFYDAQCQTLDLQSPGAAGRIDGWVNQRTQGRIQRLVQGTIDRDTALFLVNALYFKAPWQFRFDRGKTSPGDFTTLNQRVMRVPMMSQTGHFQYLTGQGFEVVALPFTDGRFEMLVFLPNRSARLSDFLSSLDGERWSQWSSQLRDTRLAIRLPRFTIQTSSKLNDPLIAMGMGVAFSDDADFRLLFKTNPRGTVNIDEVRHGVFLEVNEEGAEAAAATSVEIHARGLSPAVPPEFVVDRPFFMAIRDSHSGLLLLAGVIGDPTATAP